MMRLQCITDMLGFALLIMIIYNKMLMNTFARFLIPQNPTILTLNRSCYRLCSSKTQPGNKAPKSKKIPIQSLSELFRQSNSSQQINFDKDCLEPSELFLLILRGMKKNQHQNPEKQEKMLRLLYKYKDSPEYMKKFLYLIVPTDQLFPKMNELYREIALKYLKSGAKLNKEELYYVLENLERIVMEVRSDWSDDYWIVRDYSTEQEIANLLIPQFIAIQHQFNITIFIKLTQVCNNLAAYNPDLATFLLDNIDSPSCRIKLREYMAVLSYLSQMDLFPYEYFYKNKLRWVKTIESYNKFSSKKSFQSIKMLQLLVVENPMFCESITKKVQDILLEAIPSFDPQQQANLWFLCCKARFGIYPQIITKLLTKISETLTEMKTLELCLIVRGFERFVLLESYQQASRNILQQIEPILDKKRVYEHQIIKYLLNYQLGNQQLSRQLLL